MLLHVTHDHADAGRRGDHLVRSPPIRASATAEVYETAACSGPAVSGNGRSRTRWATSAIEADAGQLRLAARAHHGRRDADAGHAGHRQHGRVAAGAVEEPVVGAEADAEQQRGQSDHRGAPPAADQSGEGRAQRHQRQQAYPGAHREVHDGDHGHGRRGASRTAPPREPDGGFLTVMTTPVSQRSRAALSLSSGALPSSRTLGMGRCAQAFPGRALTQSRPSRARRTSRTRRGSPHGPAPHADRTAARVGSSPPSGASRRLATVSVSVTASEASAITDMAVAGEVNWATVPARIAATPAG